MKHIFIINPKAGKRDQTTRILAMAEHSSPCACRSRSAKHTGWSAPAC